MWKVGVCLSKKEILKTVIENNGGIAKTSDFVANGINKYEVAAFCKEGVIERIRSGEKQYHFIEIMACPGGCLNGGGQPVAKYGKYAETMLARRKGVQSIDRNKSARISCDSSAVQKLYEEFLVEPGSEIAHKLLHTSYSDESDII